MDGALVAEDEDDYSGEEVKFNDDDYSYLGLPDVFEWRRIHFDQVSQIIWNLMFATSCPKYLNDLKKAALMSANNDLNLKQKRRIRISTLTLRDDLK